MPSRVLLATLALLVVPAAASAQHGAGGDMTRTPPREASQFDFLLGQWELTVTPKATSMAARIHGSPQLLGTWKAWRAADGWAVTDELRIMDASGNPLALTTTIRAFDPRTGAWDQSALSAFQHQFVRSGARMEGTVMVSSSTGTDAEGKPFVSRMRFTDIGADGFKVRQDRSTDGGATWEEGVLRIEARRTAPAAAR